MRAELTQAEMAALMGMSLSGYRKWEQGRRRVTSVVASTTSGSSPRAMHVQRALLERVTGTGDRRGFHASLWRSRRRRSDPSTAPRPALPLVRHCRILDHADHHHFSL